MGEAQTVFYSWQADLPGRTNRSFIEECLERAAKSLRADESLTLEVRIDRDTADVGGSPAIAETILRKISRAEIFVPDVSIVARTGGGKAIPNPNVLLELGYAVSVLGWDRIIMVMNTAFGAVTELPFDLKGRRVMPYLVDVTPGAPKAEERRSLEAKLKDAMAAILGARETHTDAESRKERRNLIEQARQFSEVRLNIIGQRQGPAASLSSDKLICIHVVPTALPSSAGIAVNELDTRATFLPPFGSKGFNTEFNGEGLLRVDPDSAGKNSSYLQVFRNGTIESVNSQMLIGRGRENGLPGPAFCRMLGLFLSGVIQFSQEVKIRPPVCILLTVIGVKDAPLLVEAHPGYYERGFDRDVIRLPEIVLDDFASNPDPKRLLRPALDVLWQHAGLDSCPYFLSDGTWNLRML